MAHQLPELPKPRSAGGYYQPDGTPCRRYLSQPCRAVGVAKVQAAQLLLDPLQVDAETHAAVQTAELPDAVREVDALLPHPGAQFNRTIEISIDFLMAGGSA